MFRSGIAVLITAALFGVSAVYGHGKATERYIPIGQSPDSDKSTLLGVLEAVDAKTNVLQLRSGYSLHTITVTRDTRIWLDRSKRKVTNLPLRLSQLQPGQIGEVRCAGGTCDGDVIADWIKVEIKTE